MKDIEISLFDAGIPEYMHGGIVRYITDHNPPGDFLRAIITNNLKESFRCADETNQVIIHKYIHWFYQYAPSNCWGSEENYKRWLRKDPF